MQTHSCSCIYSIVHCYNCVDSAAAVYTLLHLCWHYCSCIYIATTVYTVLQLYIHFCSCIYIVAPEQNYWGHMANTVKLSLQDNICRIANNSTINNIKAKMISKDIHTQILFMGTDSALYLFNILYSNHYQV